MTSCRYSYDSPKAGNEIRPDKNSAAQPIMQSSEAQGPSGPQPIAPHTVIDSSHSTSTTSVTNPDGSTTTTTTTIGSTTTTTTIVTPSEDPPSIAVSRPARAEEAKAHGCSGEATVLEQGLDSNRDGVLNQEEITQSSVACQAKSGTGLNLDGPGRH